MFAFQTCIRKSYVNYVSVMCERSNFVLFSIRVDVQIDNIFLSYIMIGYFGPFAKLTIVFPEKKRASLNQVKIVAFKWLPLQRITLKKDIQTKKNTEVFACI